MFEQHTAQYKDIVCYEQSAYGCKDEFGVVYPIYYEQMSIFKFKNTDIVKQLFNTALPYHLNSASQVLLYPVRQPKTNED